MSKTEQYSPLPPWQRTDYCGAIRATDVGREVALWGWVQTRRDHGGLIFIDLRDRDGIVQLVLNPVHDAAAHEAAGDVRSEFYVAVKGKVVRRAEGTVNAELPTGEIEVLVSAFETLSASAPVPFQIADGDATAEEIRLKYRYLDLRRPEMQRNLRRRHQALQAVRSHLDQNGFIDVETPILFKSTPEGARDYLVPSRVHHGQFYALPQSPQIFKQILMISGMDRYFQIVRCFRDEDLRADRQPEFTQLDLEMSFPRQEDIFEVIERVMIRALEVVGVKAQRPFRHLDYKEALRRYGSDKPDLRFGTELHDVTQHFEPARATIHFEGNVQAVVAPGAAGWSRKQLDELGEVAKSAWAFRFRKNRGCPAFCASRKESGAAARCCGVACAGADRGSGGAGAFLRWRSLRLQFEMAESWNCSKCAGAWPSLPLRRMRFQDWTSGGESPCLRRPLQIPSATLRLSCALQDAAHC